MKKHGSATDRPEGTLPTGIELLHDPHLNKGTAFTEAERDALKLRGLLPPRAFTQEQQMERIIENFRGKITELEKYVYLVGLQERNERLFYRTVMEYTEEMMPIIYTPTVGEACKRWGHIYRRPRGLYVSVRDKGRVRELLRNWPVKEVAVIVVTDGERILGLGDLGAYGMGIPIGKLALYSACAGIDPRQCLPVMLDVGTNNDALLSDPLYFGALQRRLKEPAYDELVDEFVDAVQDEYPGALLQFEDFATDHATRLLERYRHKICTFNDDIQGTAGVVLAGLWSSQALTGMKLSEQKILFLGAGSAATGIAHLIASAMMQEGLSKREAYNRNWFVDSKGLVVKSRTDLKVYKQPFAHDHAFLPDLLGAVKALRPTTLIGVSAQAQTFTEPVLREMAAINKHPIIFALSNPTTKAECTAEQAYRFTDGRVVFASGSPFPPVEYNGKRFVPGQGNNAYVFPGVGLGVNVAGAKHVTDTMFAAAARALADCVTRESLDVGCVYPPLRRIREVSAKVASAVVTVAVKEGLARKKVPSDPDALLSHVRAAMYDPHYEDYLHGPGAQLEHAHSDRR